MTVKIDLYHTALKRLVCILHDQHYNIYSRKQFTFCNSWEYKNKLWPHYENVKAHDVMEMSKTLPKCLFSRSVSGGLISLRMFLEFEVTRTTERNGKWSYLLGQR